MIPKEVGLIADVLRREGYDEREALIVAWRIYHALQDKQSKER